jgi:ribosome-binding protein aMBF1 (putative translation factor)
MNWNYITFIKKAKEDLKNYFHSIVNMDNQDTRNFIIKGKPKPLSSIVKNIVPKGQNADLHKLKIENEQENFIIKKVPKALGKEIAEARNVKKFSQKDMAVKLNVLKNIYVDIESGKAIYDQKTKEIIQKIQKLLGTKFNHK